MRSGNLAAVTALFALMLVAPAQAPMPHLERKGAVTHLTVDGKPWLSLAGELLNNAASTAENARPIWPVLAKMHLNTVLVGVGWGWTEVEPGKYDFSVLDSVLRDARSNHLRVVLLWFGSWKNGTSSYAPAWVKRNWQKYPIVRDSQGKGREILSPLSDVNRDADAQAYAALLRHVRETDSATRTVIMIQLENEVGVLGDSRDRSKEANDAFASPVPKELMDYLASHKSALLPETRKLWEDAGGKTSGSWQDVFGTATGADEAFMAWHYARYMNRIAELGKKEYALPVFVNAWLVQPQGKKPGDYPSGGPQAHNHDFWRAGAPAIDVLAPDIYLPNFAEIATLYSRSGNPLFIPETRADAANAFYAIGQLNAQMYSPFGIERQADPSGRLAKAYDVLAQLAPVILEHQADGTMKAAVVQAGADPTTVPLGNYVFDLAVGRGWRATKPAAGHGYALMIQTSPDEFWVAGADLNVRFASTRPDAPMASLASAEEGRFEDGAWIVQRRLAGDDTGMGGDDRASLRLTTDPSILRILLYSYR
jgi:hypothetical protein